MLQKYKNLVTTVILLLIFLLLTKVLNNFIEPIGVIVILTYISSPIYKALNNNKIFSPKVSALIALLFINTFIVILIVFLGSFTYNKIFYFMENQYNGFMQYIVDVWNSFSFTEKLTSDLLKQNVLNITSKYLNNIDFLTKGAVYTTDGIFTYFIGNIAAYFLLKDSKNIIFAGGKIITEEKMAYVVEKAREIHKVFKVMIMVVILNTVITVCGFSILNVDNAFLLGIVCGILDIIPIVGTIFVFGPLILYNVSKGGYIIALGLLLLYILLIFYAQIIETKFMSDKLKIHPLPMIIAIYVGMKFSGILGVIMAVIYIIIINELLFKGYEVK